MLKLCNCESKACDAKLRTITGSGTRTDSVRNQEVCRRAEIEIVWPSIVDLLGHVERMDEYGMA